MRERGPLFSSFVVILWNLAVLAALLSGFAHLPIAYRYGIIDTWNTSPTVVHYWAAAALLLLGAYAVIVWTGSADGRFRLSRWGWLRVVLVSLLSLSGLVLILHNLDEVSIFGAFYAACKLGHLALAFLFAFFLLVRGLMHLWGKGRCILPLQGQHRR